MHTHSSSRWRSGVTADAVLLVFEYGCAQVHEDRDQSTVKNGPHELFSGVLLPLCVLRLREVRVRYGEQLWSSCLLPTFLSLPQCGEKESEHNGIKTVQ